MQCASCIKKFILLRGRLFESLFDSLEFRGTLRVIGAASYESILELESLLVPGMGCGGVTGVPSPVTHGLRKVEFTPLIAKGPEFPALPLSEMCTDTGLLASSFAIG